MLMKVHLDTEAPVLGCGQRIVAVEVGRKWVKLIDPFTFRTARITQEQWHAIAKRSKPADMPKAKLKALGTRFIETKAQSLRFALETASTPLPTAQIERQVTRRRKDLGKMLRRVVEAASRRTA